MENKIMQRLIMAVIILSSMVMCSRARGEDATKWTTENTITQLVLLTLLELDREQTITIAKPAQTYSVTSIRNGVITVDTKNYDNYKEDNLVIGDGAHRDKVNLYFTGCAVGHTAIAVGLPYLIKAVGGSDELARNSRRAWQYIWISAEVYQVVKNYTIGVRGSFN